MRIVFTLILAIVFSLSSTHAESDVVRRKPKKTISSPIQIFSTCYNDQAQLGLLDSINTISDSSFNAILVQLGKCRETMREIGIIDNPCDDALYEKLHFSEISQLSEREFMILHQLRRFCFEFQEACQWYFNFCSDSVFNSLLQKQSLTTLSTNETKYLHQLNGDCLKVHKSLGNNFDQHWKHREKLLPQVTIFEDEPSPSKGMQIAGGALLIPGMILPIAGGIMHAKSKPNPDDFIYFSAVDRFIAKLMFALGIACDCAGLTLISLGVAKQKKFEDYHKIKKEYLKYKQISPDISLHLNLDF